MAKLSPFSQALTYIVPIDIGLGNSGKHGLQRLLLLRSFVTVASVVILLVFQSSSNLNVSLTLIAPMIAAAFISVAFGYWRLQHSRFIGNVELFCQLLVDSTLLIVLLLNTGGVSNPLISYLLVLLAVTATLLPRNFVNLFALIAILIYTSFLLIDIQSGHPMGEGPEEQELVFQLHLVGMWVIFLVSSILISVFITHMANAIKIREINLAQARESEIRNEQLVAIGTLAAGTAHALGTPLSTMAILLTELDKLDDEELKVSAIKDDISVLRQQVTRCKHSITQLTRYYNKDNPDEAEKVSLIELANEIKDYVNNIYPSASVAFNVDGEDDIEVSANLSVRHAVINIIENGIKAASNHVKVSFKILKHTPDTIQISINDDGPGIPDKVLEQMGEPFISTQKDSMGLGIFLANATIQRLGGTIEMLNLQTGGALTLIKLPISEYESS